MSASVVSFDQSSSHLPQTCRDDRLGPEPLISAAVRDADEADAGGAGGRLVDLAVADHDRS